MYFSDQLQGVKSGFNQMYRISLVIEWSFFLPKQSKKDLDPSCKMDLDLWDCLGRVKLVL